MKFLLFLIAIGAVIKISYGANILMLSGIPSPSHFIFNKALVEGLAARGHNLTFMSPDLDKKATQNIHYVHLEQMYATYYDDSAEHVDLMDMAKESTLQSVFSFYTFGSVMCDGLRNSKGTQQLLDYPDDFKFDLVIHDFTCGPCLLGFYHKFNYPPMIGLSAFSNPPYTVDISGGDKLGLTTKPFYLLKYDLNMNIFERLHNGFIHFLDSFYRKYFAVPAIDKKMKEIFGLDLPYAGDLEKMHSFFLVNSNPAVDFPDSMPPNTVEVGGLQIKDGKPVPKEFEDFMVKGKKGAVIMALGSNIRSADLGEEKIKMIVEAFRQIPDYNFIWKFESTDQLKNLPPNLKISEWLPQNDILAHPKTKLFISHAGMLSSHEAVYWGVPIVGIPFLADQHRNLHKSVMSGTAVAVDIQSLTTQILKKAINEVLSNPSYSKNMKIRSQQFRDQKEKPLERAIWWTEYILRNPNPIHLQPAVFNLGLLGSHFWDIQLIILVALVLVGLVIKNALKAIFCSGKKVVKSKKNN